MASPSFLSYSLCLVFAFWVLLISPTQAQNCTSQKLPNNKLYKNCTDLPTLSATLHYTYNTTNSSLSLAFIAPPSKPNGWIAWGINPNGTGMAGTQALLAGKFNGSVVSVRTYNLVSYRDIEEEELSFDVWDVSATSYTDSSFAIFASVKVPRKNVDTINQVWQVGASITNGVPDKHEFTPQNLNAKGELDLVRSEKDSVSVAPANAPSGVFASAPSNSDPAGNGTNDGFSVGGGFDLSFLFGLFVILASFIGF